MTFIRAGDLDTFELDHDVVLDADGNLAWSNVQRRPQVPPGSSSTPTSWETSGSPKRPLRHFASGPADEGRLGTSG